MSGSSSESLGDGALVCPYHPFCKKQHEAWQCVRLVYMSAELRRAIDIDKRVCLVCRAQGVRADGKCSQCGRSSTREPEPTFPEVQRPEPAWTLVKQAGKGQDFYECMTQSEVARRYPGSKGELVKDINILFDYEAEYTLVYSQWLANMDVEVYSVEPVTVTLPLGRQMETRQIAIIPLASTKEGGESVFIAARIVDGSTWSQVNALGIKDFRGRFDTRPTISMAHTCRKRGTIDLLVGQDNRNIFPEVLYEGWLKGDDLFLCGIPFKPGQVVWGAAQRNLRWIKLLRDPEDAKKPEVAALAKAKARARAQPGSVGIDRRVSVTSSAGQSPRHGLPDDIWGAEGGSSCRGETPIPSDLEADFPEPEVPRHVRLVGDADFCKNRAVVELPEPEAVVMEDGVDVLSFAVNTSLQVGEERRVTYVDEEAPMIAPEERASGWESDAEVGPESRGAARGLSSPARILEEEQQVEEYLRVATPDIEAMFRKPVWDMTGMLGASADVTQRYLNEYGARCQEVEHEERVYRANREQAKVWRRARDEEIRCKQEAEAQQALIWQRDVERQAAEAMKRSEEERKKAERRRKKAEKEQLEEQKRSEEMQQLEEKRRKEEAKKKEEKERREEKKRKTEEEAHRIRRKEVDAATAKAKKEKEE